MRVAFVLCIMLSGLIASAAYSTLQSSLTVNANGVNTSYAGGFNTDGLSSLQQAFLGRIFANGSLSLNNIGLRVQATGGGTTCSGTFFYRCYRQGSAAPSFTAVNLTGPNNIAAGIFLWNSNSSIDLMNSLTTPGVYVVECYWNSTGNASNASCSTSFNDNNSGNYYQAFVEYCMTDAFSDGNFNLSPQWTGDTNDFIIVNTSDVAASDAVQSNTLRLNTPAGNGTKYLSKLETNWSSSQTWSFWIGRRGQVYNNNNNVAIWLLANESNLESSTVDGYRLFIGDNNGADELRLQSVTNNSPTNIFVSSTGIANNRTDVGFNVIVRRSEIGVWTLHTSILPITNSSGLNANTSAFSTATILQATATNTLYTPSGNGYMGLVVNHTNNANAIRAFEFDNFYFTGGPQISCTTFPNILVDSGCGVVVPDVTSYINTVYNSQMAQPITVSQFPTAGTILQGSGSTVVTITATDARLNTGSCQMTIQRIDDLPPTFNCPSDIITANDPGSCGAMVNYSISAIDNCMNCAPTIISGYTLIGSSNGHTYFRSNTAYSWAAANTAAANLGGHLATISSAAENTFLSSIGTHWIGLTDESTEGTWTWVNGEPFIYSNWAAGEPNNSGNQDYGVINYSGSAWDDDGAWSNRPFILEFDCVQLQLITGLPAGSLFPIGTTPVSYSATDASGNTALCSFNVIVNDTSQPTISCPANLTVSANSGACSAVVNYSLPIATDNCGNCSNAPVVSGFTALGTFNGKAYYLSNASANYNTARSMAIANGGHLLTVGSASENIFVSNAVNAIALNTWYWLGLSDELTEGTFAWSTGETLVYTNWSSGEPNNSGNNEDYAHVWNNGLWNDLNGNNAIRFVIEKSCITPVLTTGLPSGSAFPVGVNQVTYTATDASGNSSSCSFQITVLDSNAPLVICPGNQNINLNGSCTAVMPDYRSLVAASDNCTPVNNVLINQTPAPNTLLSGAGIQVVSMTATDASGNSSICTFNLNKLDAIAPTIVCPSNLTVNAPANMCGAVVTFAAPTIADNCSSCTTGNALAGYTYLGAIGTTGYYISNSATSFATAQANSFSVGGHLASINSASENTFIRNAANSMGFGSYGIGLSDQITEGTWAWSNGDAVSFTNWQAGEPNNSGNEDFIQVYNTGFWNDINSNLTYILEKPCLNLTQTAGLPSGSMFPIGTTNMGYSVVDNSGNTATCSFSVTVIDQSAPVLTCPSNVVVNVPIGSCSATVNYATVTATDNCGNCTSPTSIAGFTLLGTFNGSAYYIANATATNGAVAQTNCVNQGGHLAAISSLAENQFIRNAATSAGFGSYLIGYNDVITEGAFVWSNGQNLGFANWNAGEPNNSGNEDYTQVLTNGFWNDISGNNAYYVLEKTCVPVTRTAGLASGSAFPVGVTTVTHQATDASGNIATCSFTVTVNEFIPPTITCPSNQTLSLGVNCSVALPDYRGLASAADNCTPSNALIMTQSPAPGTIVAGQGTMTVGITVTDASGNSSTCNFNVNKLDITGPNIVCPANQTLYMNSNCQAIWPDYRAMVSVSDNCSSNAQLVITQSPAPGSSVAVVGTYPITISAVDAQGNSNACNFSVGVMDIQAPSIQCPNTQTLVLVNGQIAVPDYSTMIISNDDCGGTVSIAQMPSAGTIITTAGIHQIQMIASDNSGNLATCTFDLDVLSITTEVALLDATVLWNENDGFASLTVSILNPSPNVATTCEIAAIGNIARINNQAIYPVTFPAGSSSAQVIQIVISDDLICSEDDAIHFQLQNVAGGYNATAGANNASDATIADNEYVRPIRLSEDAEAGWNGQWQMSTVGDWSIDNLTPINGLNSIKHALSSGNGLSTLTYELDNRLMIGVETTWKWQWNTMGIEPTPSNYFMTFLSADQSDLTQGISGYAVGVKPSTTAAPDLITLWRVQVGNIYVPLITSSIDINNTHQNLGMEIHRDANGLWTMWIDENGGEDNMILAGSANDQTYHDIHQFGILYKYDAASAGAFMIDDIQIQQKACGEVYYSQNTGIAESAVWSKQPIGTALSVTSSPFNSYVIQAGHTITLGTHFAAFDVRIENGGTLNASDKKLYVYNDLDVQGVYTPGDGYLIFKGENTQEVVANADLNFKNVIVDNDGQTVYLPTNVKTNILQNKVLCIYEGQLETNNQLVLKSSSMGTASIGEIKDAGQLQGKVAMERYIPSLNNYPYGSWVALGCSVKGQTIADWNDNMITSGYLGSDYPPPYSFTNIQYYDESVAGAAGNGYVGVASNNDSLLWNKGYFVYMQTPTQFVDVTGYIQQHAFNQPLSYTNTNSADDGWNLMVNQYPSEIDFRQLATNSQGVGSYYLYDAEAANYKVYNGLAHVGTAPQCIAMNQSFFVQAVSSGAYLNYNEKYKTNLGVSWERTLPNAGFATFQMAGPNSKDECILYLHENATNGFEYQLDAKKIQSANPNAVEMALVGSDNLLMTIDSRNPVALASEIYLYVEMPIAGNYTFTIGDVQNLPLGTCYFIEDLVNGNTAIVAAGHQWTITNAGPYAGNRFKIHTQQAMQLVVEDPTCASANNGSIELTNVSVDWVSIAGNNGTLVSSLPNTLSFQNLAAGDYLIAINPLIAGCATQQIGITLSSAPEVLAEIIELSPATCNQLQDGHFTLFVEDQSSFQYTLRDENGMPVLSGNAQDALVEFDSLQAQQYTVEIITACFQQTVVADLTDPEAVLVSILSDDLTLQVEEDLANVLTLYQNNINALEIEWTLNGNLVTADQVFEYPFYLSGDHQIGVFAHNDRCSATDQILVQVSAAPFSTELDDEQLSLSQSAHHVQLVVHELHTPIQRIDIFDLNGKLVYTESVQLMDGLHVMPKGQWGTGIYSVVMYRDEHPEIKKIFITKNP
jgi:Lectin C-type domain/HYR domain